MPEAPQPPINPAEAARQGIRRRAAESGSPSSREAAMDDAFAELMDVVDDGGSSGGSPIDTRYADLAGDDSSSTVRPEPKGPGRLARLKKKGGDILRGGREKIGKAARESLDKATKASAAGLELYQTNENFRKTVDGVGEILKEKIISKYPRSRRLGGLVFNAIAIGYGVYEAHQKLQKIQHGISKVTSMPGYVWENKGAIAHSAWENKYNIATGAVIGNLSKSALISFAASSGIAAALSGPGEAIILASLVGAGSGAIRNGILESARQYSEQKKQIRAEIAANPEIAAKRSALLETIRNSESRIKIRNKAVEGAVWGAVGGGVFRSGLELAKNFGFEPGVFVEKLKEVWSHEMGATGADSTPTPAGGSIVSEGTPTDLPPDNPELTPQSIVATAEPTAEPTDTAMPTQIPRGLPDTGTATPEPTIAATAEPSPTSLPTSEPTLNPTETASPLPTSEPTHIPTTQPASFPTAEATAVPASEPTHIPAAEATATSEPIATATSEPTLAPTAEPTVEPSATAVPTNEPTAAATIEPAATASPIPTAEPSGTPPPWPEDAVQPAAPTPEPPAPAPSVPPGLDNSPLDEVPPQPSAAPADGSVVAGGPAGNLTPDQTQPSPAVPRGLPDDPTAIHPPVSGEIDPATGLAKSIAEKIDHLPAEIPLNEGENGWTLSEQVLKDVLPLGTSITDQDIYDLDRALMDQHGIAVPEWNMSGVPQPDTGQILSDRELHDFKFQMTPQIKSVLMDIAKRK